MQSAAGEQVLEGNSWSFSSTLGAMYFLSFRELINYYSMNQHSSHVLALQDKGCVLVSVSMKKVVSF